MQFCERALLEIGTNTLGTGSTRQDFAHDIGITVTVGKRLARPVKHVPGEHESHGIRALFYLLGEVLGTRVLNTQLVPTKPRAHREQVFQRNLLLSFIQ